MGAEEVRVDIVTNGDEPSPASKAELGRVFGTEAGSDPWDVTTQAASILWTVTSPSLNSEQFRGFKEWSALALQDVDGVEGIFAAAGLNYEVISFTVTEEVIEPSARPDIGLIAGLSFTGAIVLLIALGGAMVIRSRRAKGGFGWVAPIPVAPHPPSQPV